MLNSLTSGVSGVQQFQNQIDVIGNNIANINTLGYRASRAEFADNFSQALMGTSGQTSQIGTGVLTSGVTTRMEQGTIVQTSQPWDMAINGEGFFIVKNSVTGEGFATRAGNFENRGGFLTTREGLRVQGFTSGNAGAVGDIQLNDDPALHPEGTPAGTALTGFRIDDQGQLIGKLANGSEYVRAQVLLQGFGAPNALIKEGQNLYSGIAAAAPVGSADGLTGVQAQTNGMGLIQAGSLEYSNVDLTNEFADLITSQRSFQASARMITTSDELLQETINLKR